MSEWNPIATAPVNRVVMTKIDDDNGARNEAGLFRSGNMWFVPDGSMYVYYQPTHWRTLKAFERAELYRQLERKRATDEAAFSLAMERV